MRDGNGFNLIKLKRTASISSRSSRTKQPWNFHFRFESHYACPITKFSRAAFSNLSDALYLSQ